MATKDERPGLLSKVALFVRNPTKDWSELDQLESRATAPQESAQDRQALKTMIERKRQNDFVRKREFDQLRKLRNRAPGAPAVMARPSFFQSSLPIEDEGRSVTLKKIDEIEAQMSKQWWKGKQAGAANPNASAADTLPASGVSTVPVADASTVPVTATLAASVKAPAGREDHPQPTPSQLPFAVTQVITQPGEAASPAGDFVMTQSVSDLMSIEMERSQALVKGRAASNYGFALSAPSALDESALANDPELEEAAIRYANGDDEGAEQCLLAALREGLPDVRHAGAQAEALIDFYRTTGNKAGFDKALREFAPALQGHLLTWEPVNVMAPAPAATPVSGEAATAEAAASSAPAGRTFTWCCPARLTGADMEVLRDILMSSPQPWTLDWSLLQQIAPDAIALLDDFFASLCEEALELQFFASDRLVQVLRAFVASGNRQIDDVWWQVRLNVLRVLAMQDDFELAALDYCVNLGVAPPTWMAAQCDCSEITVAERALFGVEQPRRQAAPAVAAAVPDPLRLELNGELLGDAGEALAGLQDLAADQSTLLVYCDNLIRVDFAAAGGILNWVVTRHADGKQVQFLNVNRLVAAFFGVIGIHENAKVVLRAI